MNQDFEAELRVALAEGLLSENEVASLREEALRLARAPLALLHEQGRISEEMLVGLIARVRTSGQPTNDDPDETVTIDGQAVASQKEGASEVPAFPVMDWERYQCVRFLGEGGMGRVFLAYDPRLSRNVALKFVRGEDPELTRRFLSEARAQARVNHERVCKVYEVGEVQGRVYIAMQFIEGRPLSALARELTIEQKALVLRDAAEGVHEAHRVGLIHRDLKPSNIMVERADDGTLRPYVMDFGLARDWNESNTATGTVLGTPHYMSPEQARGEVSNLDRRTDVYSLGATLYSVLTGQPPIPGNNGLEVLNNIFKVEPRPPRSLVPDIPADLEAIALKCLEKERSARYDSARAVAEELERFLLGEPVHARSTGAWYRLRKRLHKHRRLVSLVAAAVVVVLLALGWGGMARREAAVRERLARRFTESVERVEALARYSDLSRLHDTRVDQRVIRARMQALEAEIQEAGEQAVGPGHYALGRGYLALGDEVKAHEYLDSAWRNGFREPRVAYALALVNGHLYQEQLLEAERIRNSEQREARKREIEHRYRAPALAYLRQSEGAEVPSTAYVAALLAFYEDRWDEALASLETIRGELSWFYEAPKLRGDIFLARANRYVNEAKPEQALADFEAGRKAYADAAAIGESTFTVHIAMAELEYSHMVMELYGKGAVHPPFTRGQEAVSRALQANPDDYRARLLEARFLRRLAEFRSNQGQDSMEVHQKSVVAAQAALELAPTRLEVRKELGRSYWRWGQSLIDRNQDPRDQLRKSMEMFEGIGSKDRDDDVYVQLGLTFQTWADYEDQVGLNSLEHRGQALDAYLAALRLNDKLPDVWIDLGTTYFTRSTHPKSVNPGDDLKQAQRALDKALSLNPHHIVACFYAGRVHDQLAQHLRGRGEDARPELTRAIDMYRQGLSINPQIPQLHNGLGLVLLEQAAEAWERGEDPFPFLAQARAVFEQATAVAPQHGLGELNVGEVLTRQARYQQSRGEDPLPSLQKAVQVLKKAAPRLEGNVLLWANLAMIYSIQASTEMERGRTPQPSLALASEALQKAFSLNPNHAQSWFYLGEIRGLRARWAVSQGEGNEEGFEEAAQAYEKALELAPEAQEYRLAFGHFCLAWAAWQQGASSDARHVLEHGLELATHVLSARPGAPDARILRAKLLVALADLSTSKQEQKNWRSSALDDFTQALSANPNLKHKWTNELVLLQQNTATTP
ncbi:MAG: protein kinase domain-containing protein [Hyalangium sp.]|uniref:protein kinase domain-containing protein n=1 Tax=Hyalangium sp. TaxID=2028555 RepID=UPI003899FA2C